MTELLPHQNEEDEHSLGTLLETGRPKEIIEAGKTSWDLTKS